MRKLGWALVASGVTAAACFHFVACNALWYEDARRSGILGALIGLGLAIVGLLIVQSRD